MLISSDKSIKQIAREIGCSLGVWERNYEEEHSVAGKSMEGMNLQELWEHKKLHKELSIVKEEREILKKAAAIQGR